MFPSSSQSAHGDTIQFTRLAQKVLYEGNVKIQGRCGADSSIGELIYVYGGF